MGDVHEVIPTTKTISTYQKITGRCNASDDATFSLKRKTDKAYNIAVNFKCSFEFNKSPLLGLKMLINYEVQPTLNERTIDFSITKIEGTPEFQ